jgi:hypothetical protein
LLNQPPKADLPPPPQAAEPEPNRSPLLAGLCVLGGIVAGFAIYFANQKEG